MLKTRSAGRDGAGGGALPETTNHILVPVHSNFRGKASEIELDGGRDADQDHFVSQETRSVQTENVTSLRKAVT